MASKGRRWLLFISLLAIIGFALNLYTSATFEAPPFPGVAGNLSAPFAPGGPFGPFLRARLGLPLHSMFLASALLIVAVVPVSYYIVSESLEQNLEAKFNLISKLVKGGRVPKAGPSADGEIVLKFLNPGERKVVEALVRKKGEMMQAELSRLDGMDKLRTHRAIRDLARKDVVSVHARGKMNLVSLSKDVRELFG